MYTSQSAYESFLTEYFQETIVTPEPFHRPWADTGLQASRHAHTSAKNLDTVNSKCRSPIHRITKSVTTLTITNVAAAAPYWHIESSALKNLAFITVKM
jgi:hypothetical protein